MSVPAEARAATNEAIERVERNADPMSKADLLAAVHRMCKAHQDFTTDDVWESFEGVRPHEPRVLGAVMRTAQKNGWCESTTEYRLSKRREAHSNPKRVWRSLVFVATAYDPTGDFA